MCLEEGRRDFLKAVAEGNCLKDGKYGRERSEGQRGVLWIASYIAALTIRQVIDCISVQFEKMKR